MNAGLPGTGLGGIFYLVLALYMPLHELVRTLRGRGSRERWRLALTQASIAAGIVTVVVLVTLGASRLVPRGRGDSSWVLVVPLTAAVVLVVLVVVVGAWGRWVAWHARTADV